VDGPGTLGRGEILMGHPLEQLDPSDRATACQPVADTHPRVGSDDSRVRALSLIAVDGAQAKPARISRSSYRTYGQPLTNRGPEVVRAMVDEGQPVRRATRLSANAGHE
jgi:hypothetical protein